VLGDKLLPMRRTTPVKFDIATTPVFG
jgi:hypothetical protein